MTANPRLPPSSLDWSRRLHGEPRLSELLGDEPLIRLMQRDGVTVATLDMLTRRARSHLCHDTGAIELKAA